jgi:hypothetical protein
VKSALKVAIDDGTADETLKPPPPVERFLDVLEPPWGANFLGVFAQTL